MLARATAESIIPVERIASQIYVIREQNVMIDSDLAALYEVTTGNLNLAVRRNKRRFPEDFVFQLTSEEFESLLLQTAIANGRGGRRTPPFAFTEHGVAMLSSVLHSDRAADVNVAIMRTFIRLRQVLGANEELARKVAQHDEEIGALFEHIQGLLEPPEPPKRFSREGRRGLERVRGIVSRKTSHRASSRLAPLSPRTSYCPLGTCAPSIPLSARNLWSFLYSSRYFAALIVFGLKKILISSAFACGVSMQSGAICWMSILARSDMA